MFEENMINAEKYMSELTERLKNEFGDELVYVGLQGSYLRGEENENSDIDVVVILSELNLCSLIRYRKTLESMGDFEKSCGFICGRSEMKNWNRGEIFHFRNSTQDIYGSLDELIPEYTHDDTVDFIRLSLNNVYHELCHRYVHSSDKICAATLNGILKSAFFILQDICFIRTGEFPVTHRSLGELKVRLGENDRAVIDLMTLENYDFEEAYVILLRWCGETLSELN